VLFSTEEKNGSSKGNDKKVASALQRWGTREKDENFDSSKFWERHWGSGRRDRARRDDSRRGGRRYIESTN